MTAQVADMAIELFIERGYEGTTIDDICGVAGISRSTFFRYFHSKEDVLVREVAGVGDHLLSALQARPDDETPWIAIRRALDPLIELYGDRSEWVLRTARLVLQTPELVTFNQEKRAGWQELLRPEVARRLGADPDDPTDPRPGALAASALGCFDAAVAAWTAGNGAERLAGILDRAMGSVA
jgi:AcrR family transcriptional regulator